MSRMIARVRSNLIHLYANLRHLGHVKEALRVSKLSEALATGLYNSDNEESVKRVIYHTLSEIAQEYKSEGTNMAFGLEENGFSFTILKTSGETDKLYVGLTDAGSGKKNGITVKYNNKPIGSIFTLESLAQSYPENPDYSSGLANELEDHDEDASLRDNNRSTQPNEANLDLKVYITGILDKILETKE